MYSLTGDLSALGNRASVPFIVIGRYLDLPTIAMLLHGFFFCIDEHNSSEHKACKMLS